MFENEEIVEQQGAEPQVDPGFSPPAEPAPLGIPFEQYQQTEAGYRAAEARAAAAEQASQLYQRQLGDLQQQMQELRGQLTRRVDTPSRTPEEERERRLAHEALKSLQAEDPSYQRLQKVAGALPAVAQAVLALQQQNAGLTSRLAQSFAQGEESRLEAMAQQAGITFSTREEFDTFNAYVAGIIRSDPAALAAFRNGDPSVMPAALAHAQQTYVAARRQATAQRAEAKASMSRLPPRPGGGLPGGTPAPRFDPANPNAVEDQVFKNARTFLKERLA